MVSGWLAFSEAFLGGSQAYRFCINSVRARVLFSNSFVATVKYSRAAGRTRVARMRSSIPISKRLYVVPEDFETPALRNHGPFAQNDLHGSGLGDENGNGVGMADLH